MPLLDIKNEVLYDAKYLISHPLFVSLIAFFAGLLLILFHDMPPRQVVMAVGAAHMSWPTYAQSYQKIFKDNGVDLILIPSAGSEDDANRLMDPTNPVQISFVVSGAINPKDAKSVSTMGRVYIAPFWIFYRKGIKAGKIQTLADFNGKKINIEQTGTRANSLARTLFSLNGVNVDYHFSQFDTATAIEAMNKGEIDVLMFFSSPEAATLQKLLKNPSIELMNIERTDTYSFMFDYLDKLIVPEGGLDLSKNIPNQPTQVIAAPVELVVKNNLHPALKMLLMHAASEVHGNETSFFRSGTFPSFGRKLLPEDEEAKLFYNYGLPKLSRYLPFWALEPFNRMLLYTVPITLLIFTIMKNASEYRLSRGRRKIYAIYEELRNLGNEASFCNTVIECGALNNKLSEIEKNAMQIRLPEELLGEYFALLNIISSLRNRISSAQIGS